MTWGLKANTKKADKIHEYYIKLEDILNETINEETNELRIQSNELRLQLESKDELLASTQFSLEYQKHQMAKILNKKYLGSLPTNTIYGYKNNVNEKNKIDENESQIINLGQTENISKREVGYNTHNATGQMFYAKTCYNKELTPKPELTFRVRFAHKKMNINIFIFIYDKKI